MKSTFERNLLIGFGMTMLLLVITAVASFFSIKSLLASADWVEHTNKTIQTTQELSAAMSNAEAAQRGFLITGDEVYLEGLKKQIDAFQASVNQAKLITADNPAQQESLVEVNRLGNLRVEALQLLIEAKKNGQQVTNLEMQHGKSLMDAIKEVLKIMNARETQLLQSRTAELNKYAGYTPILIVIASALAILITIIFYLKVRSDFDERALLQKELVEKDSVMHNRIILIQNIADKIAKGNYKDRITDEGADDLGALAAHLNKMAASLDQSFEKLSEKEWVQSGIVGLNNVIISKDLVEPLTEAIIESVASYTDCQVGAFYILENDALKLSSGFALQASERNKIIQIGEGITGQVAAQGKEYIVNNIPVEFLTVNFAAATLHKLHIIALPVKIGNTVKGVIELGSIVPFSPKVLQYLRTILHDIAVALNAAQSRQKLQELLEETQAQSEELQAQHSELENLNAELEAQSLKLQTSEEELKVQQEELMQTNTELEERSKLLEMRNQTITERNQEIQLKAEQLALSTKYKSEFLANMSHELRTPLNSILLLSRLMVENNDKNLNEEQVQYAQVIQSSGNGLLSLIDEILDLSKIESGKMSFEFTNVSVPGIINDMKALFTPIANDRMLEFRVEQGPSVPEFIHTDKQKLEQVVKNLVSNALKFTAKGYVSLGFFKNTPNSDYIEIKVKDTGIGIQAEKQKLIFEAFQQADGSTRRKYGGTGLGLSISRELVHLLGGEIKLTSKVNEGSEFVIYLPISKAEVIPTQTTSVTNGGVQDDGSGNWTPFPEDSTPQKEDQLFVTAIIPPAIPDDREELAPEDKIILIIEDDTAFAQSLLNYTRKKGYKGIVTVRGDEGVALAKQFTPLGILLDIQLPVRSGWEVMEELKRDPVTKHIPVHIMSSYQLKKESLMKGAIDFINKPMAFEKINEVFQKIEDVLKKDPKKVLIIEENAKHARALAYYLESSNVNVEIKGNIADSIDALKLNEMDCVILDMGIPNDHSYNTLDQVKKTPGLENLPIIVFTGKSLSRIEELRIRQYADSIVIKTAHSYQRILDEVSLFLHLVEESKFAKPKDEFKKLGPLNEVLRNKIVLVADDDVRNIFSLTKVLERFGMQVITAMDGKQAIAQLQENPGVHIVLMDMMMPEMDGYESIAHIRTIPKFRSLPILAVTAKAMTGDRDKCIKAGASDYITKPVDNDQLLSLLRVWLYDKLN